MPLPTLRERRAAWCALPFQQYGTCASCRQVRYVAGHRHDALRCQSCATTAPAQRRRLVAGQGVLFA